MNDSSYRLIVVNDMSGELNVTKRRKGKHIQIFSDGCPDCLSHIDNVEVGKCAGCFLEVHSIDLDSDLENVFITKYSIVSHPTTIIDDEIKVEGVPSFYWLCGDDFYDKLKLEYPLKPA